MKIYSPNKDYTGMSASVPFCGGVGETDDPHLIKWCKDHGYTVEEKAEQQPIAEETAEEEPAEQPMAKAVKKKAGQ